VDGVDEVPALDPLDLGRGHGCRHELRWLRDPWWGVFAGDEQGRLDDGREPLRADVGGAAAELGDDRRAVPSIPRTERARR
jgi:hypothetical protein